MKNLKHYGIISFLSILFLTFVFIACEDEPCNCKNKEHLGINETCCKSNGCICSEQISILILNDKEITIKKQSGITNEQMNTTVEIINEGFIDFLNMGWNMPEHKLNEIHIFNGDNVIINGTILNVGINTNYDEISGHMYIMSIS